MFRESMVFLVCCPRSLHTCSLGLRGSVAGTVVVVLLLLAPCCTHETPTRGVSTGLQTATRSWIFAAVSRVISLVSRYLAEDPVGGVEVGALVVLVDEGLLRRNASVLALYRCLQTRKTRSIICVTVLTVSVSGFLPKPHSY